MSFLVIIDVIDVYLDTKVKASRGIRPPWHPQWDSNMVSELERPGSSVGSDCDEHGFGASKIVGTC